MTETMKRFMLFSLTLLVGIVAVSAKLQMPQMFQSGMVLQRGKPIPVWGMAEPGQVVSVTFRKKTWQATATASGQWRVDLPQQKAGGPYTLEVNCEGQEVKTFTDVLVGDVWLCSGQSNVDVTIERVYPQYPDEIDGFQNDQIRLFRVLTDRDTHGPKADVLPTKWKPLSRENAWTFSALGTFLAIRMQRETGVPQGIICNSLGGTPIEAWISADSLQGDFPLYVERTRLWQDDKMVAAQDEANRRANDRWMQLLNERDPFMHLKEQTDNAHSLDDDSSWPEINQFALESHLAPVASRNNFVGSVWLRQHIYINKEHAGKPARLLLGTLFDQDYTYINGREVGRTYYQYPPRRYQVPEGLLHEGDNVLTVRFVNKYGIPHFIKEKPYMMIFGQGDTLHLSEQWRVHTGALMPSCPSGGTSIQNLPTVLYNAMLHPLAPYALSGVVWYQGESNTGEPKVYAPLLRKMMGNWRTLWNDSQLPFCIVQLANFMAPSAHPQNSSWAQLREAQRTVAVSDPYAELAVAIDLGEAVDIHPLRKREVAEREAQCMDKLVFHKKVALSPQPVSGVADGTEVSITFDQPLQKGTVYEMEVAGQDGRFVNVEAQSDGRSVVIKSPVASVTRVRYAWKDNPVRANLYSLAGLPAAPFEWQLGK